MGRRAGAAVEDLVYAGGSSLVNDLCSEIDFVVRGPDAGRDLDDEFGKRRGAVVILRDVTFARAAERRFS